MLFKNWREYFVFQLIANIFFHLNITGTSFGIQRVNVLNALRFRNDEEQAVYVIYI